MAIIIPRTWNVNSNIDFEKFLAQKRHAWIQYIICVDHIQCFITDEHWQVGYLLENVSEEFPNIMAAMASIIYIYIYIYIYTFLTCNSLCLFYFASGISTSRGDSCTLYPLVMPGHDRVSLCCLWSPPGMSPVQSSAIVTSCFDAVRVGCRGGGGVRRVRG